MQTTTRYTPQQNGVAERKNQTIVNMAERKNQTIMNMARTLQRENFVK
jgi:hypothetical protein